MSIFMIAAAIASDEKNKIQNFKTDFLRSFVFVEIGFRFEHTWPAISYKLNGTIFVYNPNDKRQAEELNLW